MCFDGVFFFFFLYPLLIAGLIENCVFDLGGCVFRHSSKDQNLTWLLLNLKYIERKVGAEMHVIAFFSQESRLHLSG